MNIQPSALQPEAVIQQKSNMPSYLTYVSALVIMASCAYLVYKMYNKKPDKEQKILNFDTISKDAQAQEIIQTIKTSMSKEINEEDNNKTQKTFIQTSYDSNSVDDNESEVFVDAESHADDDEHENTNVDTQEMDSKKLCTIQ